MDEQCCSQSSAGSETCEISFESGKNTVLCPHCRHKGKLVEGQTVKANISVSLRTIADTDYFFCKTADCPIAYFSADGISTYTTDQVREHVYQKSPGMNDVSVCYCFGHTTGEILAASPDDYAAILNDINTGIKAGQCACDLRNPQGSCCLGNVRELKNRVGYQTIHPEN